MNKFLSLLLVAAIIVSVAACGTKSSTAPENITPTDAVKSQTDASDDNAGQSQIDFSESVECLSYKIPYPKGEWLGTCDYGQRFSYKRDLIVFILTPSDSGIQFESMNLDEIFVINEKYVCEALEGGLSWILSPGNTRQIIKESDVITNESAIDMLRVMGSMENAQTNDTVEYLAYYIAGGKNKNYPICIIGVPLEGTVETLSDFMDEMASKITK